MKYLVTALFLIVATTSCQRNELNDMHFGPGPGDEEYEAMQTEEGCSHSDKVR